MNEHLVLTEFDGAVMGDHSGDLGPGPIMERTCRRMFRNVPGMLETTPRVDSVAAPVVPALAGPLRDVVAAAAWGTPIDAGKITRLVLVRAPDGGQLRTVISGSRTVSTMAYPSRRYGCSRYGEAETECARIREEELCPLTVEAVSQPLRVEADVDGRRLVTVIDGAVLRADGSRALVECKREWSGFRTRRGEIQAFLGRVAARALGMGYERWVLVNAGTDLRRRNVEEVQACRFVRVTDDRVARAAAILERGGTTLGRLSSELAEDPAVGRARAFALMALRNVDIDLDGELDDRAECRATPPVSPFIPGLFD